MNLERVSVTLDEQLGRLLAGYFAPSVLHPSLCEQRLVRVVCGLEYTHHVRAKRKVYARKAVGLGATEIEGKDIDDHVDLHNTLIRSAGLLVERARIADRDHPVLGLDGDFPDEIVGEEVIGLQKELQAIPDQHGLTARVRRRAVCQQACGDPDACRSSQR